MIAFQSYGGPKRCRYLPEIRTFLPDFPIFLRIFASLQLRAEVLHVRAACLSRAFGAAHCGEPPAHRALTLSIEAPPALGSRASDERKSVTASRRLTAMCGAKGAEDRLPAPAG